MIPSQAPAASARAKSSGAQAPGANTMITWEKDTCLTDFYTHSPTLPG